MADTPTNRYGARLQSLGSNTNTWGDTKLNEVIQLLDRGSKGYQALTINGDATITWTNYVATNDGQVATLKLNTGTVTASFTLTFPSKEWEFAVWNNTAYAATIKCSGGTGIVIPAARKVRLFCDATDIGDSTPNYLPTATTLTNAQDLPSYTQVQTLIANAALPATAGSLRNSAADTTSNYHAAKHTLAVSGAISGAYSTVNPGADEDLLLTLAVGAFGLTDGGSQTGSFAAAVNTRYACPFAATATITGPAAASANDVMVFFIGGGQDVSFDPNGLKVNGSTSALPLGNSRRVLIAGYSGASDGWVISVPDEGQLVMTVGAFGL